MIRRIFGIIAVTALLALIANDASAATIRMCKGVAAGKASGPARWTARGSQTTYGLDVRGCAVIAAADVNDALSSGFISDSTLQANTYTGLSLYASPMIITLPPGTFIAYLIARETSGGAVSGQGLKVGTTSGGSDVITPFALGASAINVARDASIITRAFSATATQQLFINAISSLGSSSVDITVVYGYF